MKILLTAINAKYIHSNLAVYSLKAASGDCREQIEIAEFTINNTKEHILSEIYKRKPDILCFSVYIWNLEMTESVAREFHKLCPQVPIWVGGPEVSYETEAFLKAHPYVTGVIIGEGETTFREVCEYYLAEALSRPKAELSQIPGLAYREDGAVRFTGAREPLAMSSLPFAYDLEGDFSNRIIYYESSRGCPFSCSYCLSSVEKSLRFRDVELVKKELQFFLDRRVPQIKFVDRTFNCHHKHAMEIWRYISEHDNGVTNFHFEIAADLLNEEELALMAAMRPGLIQLEIGVQSTYEPTIREIHRTMDLDDLKRIVRRIQKAGNIHQHLDLIAGLPYEDYARFRQSFDEIYAIKPNQLQLGFLKVLKGSYMYEHAAEYGLLYQDEPPYEVLGTRWLSYEELLDIKRVEEMLEVYYNSGQFSVTMRMLEVIFPSAFAFFLELGKYYERMGYAGMSHSRIRRCEILLSYLESYAGSYIIEETDQEKGCIGALLPLLEEALTYDLYWRENCKSRPKWAPALAELKEMTHRHCPKGKQSHVEPFHYRFPDKGQLSVSKLPERLPEPVWVLFSYDRRDPLDNQAAAEYIDDHMQP